MRSFFYSEGWKVPCAPSLFPPKRAPTAFQDNTDGRRSELSSASVSGTLINMPARSAPVPFKDSWHSCDGGISGPSVIGGMLRRALPSQQNQEFKPSSERRSRRLNFKKTPSRRADFGGLENSATAPKVNCLLRSLAPNLFGSGVAGRGVL